MDNRVNEVLLNSNIILEANFHYEKLTMVNGLYNGKQPMLFLLLGTIDDDGVASASEALSVVLNVDSRTGHFSFDKEQLATRIELMKVTHKQEELIGFLTINSKYYNYEETIRMILIDFMPQFVGSAIIFSYTPNESSSENKTQQKNTSHLDLSCQLIENYNIDTCDLKFQIEYSNIEIPVVSGSKSELELDEMPLQDEINYYHDRKKHIKQELSRVISYLGNASSVEQPLNAAILNRAAIITHLLNRNPTNDIETAISNMENEIRLLQTTLEQWEIVNMKDNPS
ncbi:hypothetical protein J7297_05011 [Nakaseomyces glabratus]|nr:hypothetical protein J7297_05011 [Nakaseomyces glabratus]KAH7580235.1 hypothetical protein J7296_04988 [Nakaseomyces glabratus]KTB11794.1 hypothetical protein AO443_004606 [Nakaseomyces glabratus]KTB15676.1 hypothetical protein AO442_004726 [Nakaseomyces glabratus]